MNRKRLILLTLVPAVLIGVLWGVANLWFLNRNKRITQQWERRPFTSINQVIANETWIIQKIPDKTPKSITEAIQATLSAYSAQSLETIRRLQSPAGIQNQLTLDRGQLSILKGSTGISIDHLAGESEADIPAIWEDFWKQWPNASQSSFLKEKGVQLRGVDVTSLKIIEVNNIAMTSPMSILLTPEFPSFSKFQSIARPIEDRKTSSQLKCVDVSMIVKSETGSYPLAFRFVYFNSQQRWYLTDVTSSFMHGTKQSDVYIL